MSNKFYTILNLITGMFTVIVQFATSFFLSPFIVKALGAEANGYTQLAANFVMYASLLTTAFNSMASRFVSVAWLLFVCICSQYRIDCFVVANICNSILEVRACYCYRQCGRT